MLWSCQFLLVFVCVWGFLHNNKLVRDGSWTRSKPLVRLNIQSTKFHKFTHWNNLSQFNISIHQEHYKMKINLFLMFLIPPIQSQSLETLLKSALFSAKCHAQCLSSSTPEDQLDCLSICSLVQSNTSTSACIYPTICTGDCQTACQEPVKTVSVHQDRKLSSLVQQSCQLVWKMKQKEKENFAFVVAGKDLGGMWSLIFNRITEKRVELTELMTAKFE